MPIRPSLWRGRADPRLYRAVDWADLVSLSVLDTRQYRSAPPCASPNVARNVRLEDCAAAAVPGGTILGAAQERWLSDRLAGETRPWSLVAQQVFFAPLWLDGARRTTFSDQWDGYAANRNRVLAAMARPAVRNPVVLSGDVHSFWVNDLDGPGGAAIGSEIVTSALGAASPPAGRFGDVGRNNPHVRFHDVDHAGWVRLDIDRATLRADVRMIADRGDAGSIVRSGGTFTSPSGSRRMEQG
jgi:alkaline phosphatase D